MVSKAQKSWNIDFDDCEELTQQFRTYCLDSAVALHTRSLALSMADPGRLPIHDSDAVFHAPCCLSSGLAEVLDPLSGRNRTDDAVGVRSINDQPFIPVTIRPVRAKGRKEAASWHPIFTVPSLFLRL